MEKKKHEIGRRKFIAASLSTAMAAGMAGLSPKFALADEAKEANDIIYRKLGKTGMKLPIVSFGTGACNDPGLVQAAYEKGMRHFDTAANYAYGRNEQMLGMVFKKMGVRDKVNIGTKIFVPQQRQGVSPADLKKKAIQLTDGSLKRLQSDYADIVYVHDLNSADGVKQEGLLEAMLELKKLGKAKAIGISTHTNMAEAIRATIELKEYDVILTSYNLTMADDTEMQSGVKDAAAAGIGIIAMKSQAGGGGWPNPEARRNYPAAVVNSAALKWVLNNEYITTAIPGIGNFDHLNEDFNAAYDLVYNEDERKLMSDNNLALSLGFCRGCSQCLASCPHGSDIPNLMRTHMYAKQYGDFALARATLDGIAASKSLTACGSCDSCGAVCVNSVDIASKISELKLIYT